MRIIFNLKNCGLGNNGGSLSLIKSANTLVDLGHEVIILDSMKNQHTWNPLKAEHIIGGEPSADAVIATGYKTVSSTLSLPDRCGKKYHWIRGWETWQMPEHKIVEKILKVPTIKMVNGVCLQKKLLKYNVESEIIRPGYDTYELFPLPEVKLKTEDFIIGGLYNTRHKSKRTDWIIKASNQLKKRYDIKLWMFGDKNVNDKSIDRYFCRPNNSDKNFMYNSCNIWLSPSNNEGLHICPAEAMLTKCPVVTTDAEMSGTEDYVFSGINGLVTKDDFNQFLGRIKYLINNENVRHKMGELARVQILSMGDRKLNMKVLVDFLQRNSR